MHTPSTTSIKDLTREIWYSLDPVERSDLKSFLIQQNVSKGNMTFRAARSKVRDKINDIETQDTPRRVPPLTELMFRYRDDALLNAIYPNRKKEWKPILQRKGDWNLTVKNFSFIDHPIDTFKTFAAMLYGEAQLPRTKMDFADHNVQDITSYMLLAIVYTRTNRFAWGGQMPESIQKVMKGVGLAQTMDINVPAKNNVDVYPFPLRTLGADQQSSTTIADESSRKEKTASDLTRCIEDWLKTTPEKPNINERALAKIGNFVGEILDNSERHSLASGNGGWWIAGFMARRKKEGAPDRYVCHIGVISLDQTIPQTLLNSPDVKESRFFKPYREYRAAGGLGVDKDLCAAVLSIQEGVSCKPNFPNETASGLGMGELLTGVSYLGSGSGKHKSAVTIISGKACLHIKPPYMKSDFSAHWFNKTNSMDDQPDEDRVVNIGFDFPGTIISARFELDPRHLSVEPLKEREGRYVVKKVGDEWKVVPLIST